MPHSKKNSTISPSKLIKILQDAGWQKCSICNSYFAVLNDGVCGVRCMNIKNNASNKITINI